MRDSKPSSSAQTVALAKAQLHWSGAMNDPFVERLLTARHRAAAGVLRLPALKKYGQSPTFSFLAARSCFFDDAVRNALTEGVRQVAIIGAGYDTRAWRLAQPGVQFFEVDHPATQRDKQKRAPAGEVTYVAVDLRRDSLADRLITADLLTSEPTVFVVEGLTMYLPASAAEDMFVALASLAAPGSQLAVNFTASGGGSVSPASRAVARLIRASWRLSGEPTHHWANQQNVPALLARAGFQQVESLKGPELAARYLSDSPLSTSGINPAAFCVTARRQL